MMRYNPSELYEKLTALGVKITEPDTLAKRCTAIRDERKKGKKLASPKTKTADVLPEIGDKGRPLTEIPKDYIKDVLNFVGYISDTEKRQFCLKMRNTLTGAFLTKFKPYVHRWTSVYKKSIMAKMYQLEAYTGDQLQDVEFITLTTYQRDTDRITALENLKAGRGKLLDLLNWRYGHHDYVWMLEPHKSGFSHLHLVYFKKLTEPERDSLKKLWHEKYELGDYEHGLSFSDPRPSSDGVCIGGSIRNIRNYLMKYISKGLWSESFHDYEFHGQKVPFNMSLGELLFNAILKKTKTRLWGCSRNFSKIMKRPEHEGSEEWECFEVDQYYGLPSELRDLYPDETEEEKNKHFFSVLWTKEGGLHPESVKKWVLIKSLSHLSPKDEQEAKLNDYKIESTPIPIINKRGLKVGEMPNFSVYKPEWFSLSQGV